MPNGKCSPDNPDYLSLEGLLGAENDIRVAAEEGYPVFTQDKLGLAADIFKACYFAARAQLTNPAYVIPWEINGRTIRWVARADDYDLGDSIRHFVVTQYEPPHRDKQPTGNKSYHSHIYAYELSPMFTTLPKLRAEELAHRVVLLVESGAVTNLPLKTISRELADLVFE